MRRRIVEKDGERAADHTTQRDLLGRLSATHREMVAYSLDLPRKSSARQIAAQCRKESRLREILDELSDQARRLLCKAVFDANGVALSLDSFDLGVGVFSFRQEHRVAALELERRGLAFAFVASGEVVYHVPADLQVPLRRALAVRFTGTVRRATAQQWLSALRQDLHDIAALWTVLARAPVPITLEGEIHTRSEPRLLAALPVLDLPDPDGVLTQRRLELALAQLRDTGYLRLCADEDRSNTRLVAAGDPAEGLRDATFECFPDQGSEYHGAVACALMLGQALTGRSVGLVSFENALQALLKDSRQFTPDSSLEPTILALCGLLPSWLRGELQLGLTRGRLVAVRFTRCSQTARSRVKGELADQHSMHRQTTGASERDEAWSDPHGHIRLRARTLWSPERPHSMTRKYWDPTDALGDPEIVQISTLDAALPEDLLVSL